MCVHKKKNDILCHDSIADIGINTGTTVSIKVDRKKQQQSHQQQQHHSSPTTIQPTIQIRNVEGMITSAIATDAAATCLAFIRSQRGAPLLSREGFVYRCERHIGPRSYWLCIRYKNFKCGGRLICHGNTVVKDTPHNHHHDWQRIQKSQVELKNLADPDELDQFIKAFKLERE